MITDPVGSAVWAVVPYVPAAPFRLYAGKEHEPKTVPTVTPLIDAVTRGGAELTYLVSSKTRPVLVVGETSAHGLEELLVLRLWQFPKLTDEEQAEVRDQRHTDLFHLRPEQFPGLPEENAAMIGSLTRVHASAIGTRSLGRLDEPELTTIHERIVRHFGFDLRALVRSELARAKAERSARRS